MAATVSTAALDLTKADRLFEDASYSAANTELDAARKAAATDAERVAVFWRLSRVSLMLGEEALDVEMKRSYFGKGISFAEQGLAINPRCVQCHMWHSANIGRECQTRALSKQAAAVPKMMEDLTAILETVGAVNCSEAWQALGEIYFNHPFKPTDAAINFGRKALDCIPAGELRLSTYAFLAKMLYSRNWDAAKRKADIEAGIGRFKSETKNIEKFSYYASSLGTGFTPRWSAKALAAMSDREEAVSIVNHAINVYQKAPVHHPVDDADYKALIKLLSEWK